MSTEGEVHVSIRRQWDDYRDAKVKLGALSGFHWSDISGGTGVKFNRRYLCAYIWCTDLEGQDFGHTCMHGPPPHRIKVCVIKKTNRAAWSMLESRASGK